MKKRAERFHITSESDILKKRAERFKNDLDQTNVLGDKSNLKNNKRRLRRNRRIIKWKRNVENKQMNQRDRRGPRRSLGFKKFGGRNKLIKRRTFMRRNIDN